MPLSISLSRRQTLHLKINKEKLIDLFLEKFNEHEPSFIDAIEFLDKNIVIEIDNTKNLPAPLRISAPQCIDIFRKNKSTSSGL